LNREGSVRELSAQEIVRINANVKIAPANDSIARYGTHASPLVQLTATLFFREGAPRVIALVSCKSHEGVSSLGRSFSDFLTGIGARVVLMQAADCLVWPRGRASLPAGTFGFGPSTSDSFLAAREDSDVLLVDCSSLEESPAVFMLAPHVDGVVLVVEDGRHSANEMQKAVKLIRDVKGVVLGVVLNKRHRPLPRWLYTLFSRRNR